MKTLLLIEDDPRITLALGIRLKSAGYTVFTAPDAVHAMGQARRHAPDVILLDINLPGGDGFEVARRLRSSHNTASIPIIFLTASKKPGLRERALEAGGAELLEKPFSSEVLFEAIERTVEGEDSFGAA